MEKRYFPRGWAYGLAIGGLVAVLNLTGLISFTEVMGIYLVIVVAAIIVLHMTDSFDKAMAWLSEPIRKEKSDG